MSHQHSFFLLAYLRGGGCSSLQRMSILIASHSWNRYAGKWLVEISCSLRVKNRMNLIILLSSVHYDLKCIILSLHPYMSKNLWLSLRLFI